MADIDLKTETPDTTLPSTGFLFGADSQAAVSPSVYSTQTVATALLGSTSLTGATVTTSQPVLNLAQTWNAGAVTFTGLRFNATDTASASLSLLMDLQVGGSSRFNVNKNGVATLASSLAVVAGNITTSNGYSIQATGANANIWARDNTAFFAIGGSSDTILSRRNTANLRFGAADAAAPVAQTLSVQSVVAGTSNTAGANLTITGSQGTGTGAGGSIVFQVAPAGSSGTAQNALVNALSLASTGNLTLGASGNGLFPSFQLLGTDGRTVFMAARSTGGSSAVLGLWGSSQSPFIQLGTESSFSTTVIFGLDAANTLALRNGVNAQESRVYGSYTSATNFQRLSVKTLREVSSALSGATYTSTIAIPAYAVLIGVTTRVNTAITGATSYSVGDGSDVDLWGAAIPVAINSESRTANFTAVAATGAAATSRTVTLTANGSNFTGGVVEICLHYLTTEAD
jgi:hypothetical protein